MGRALYSFMNAGRVRTSTPLRPRIDGFGLAARAAGTLTAHQFAYLADAEARNAPACVAVVGPVVPVAAIRLRGPPAG